MNVPSPNLPRGVQALLFESAERRRRLEDSVVRVLADDEFPARLRCFERSLRRRRGDYDVKRQSLPQNDLLEEDADRVR